MVMLNFNYIMVCKIINKMKEKGKREYMIL